MSEQTWFKEFYPIDAGDVPASKAIKHSLVKWRGLRKESLRKHGLTKPPIEVNDESCALCKNYISPSDFWDEVDFLTNCSDCPLKQFLGKRCDYSDNSVFIKYLDYGNPEPMIAALEVIEFVERTCK